MKKVSVCGAIAEYKLIPDGGNILAQYENGDPIYVSADYGKGELDGNKITIKANQPFILEVTK